MHWISRESHMKHCMAGKRNWIQVKIPEQRLKKKNFYMYLGDTAVPTMVGRILKSSKLESSTSIYNIHRLL